MKKLNLRMKNSAGMTYIELIVVIGIFFTMSAVVLLNSSTFRSKVEIKSLSNDIALKIVEAQKSAMSGKLPPEAQQQYLIDNGPSNWRPSYGVYFNLDTDNKSFVYFTDLNSDYMYGEGLEYLESFNITRSNYIKTLIIAFDSKETQKPRNLSLVFTRPNSSAFFAVDGEVQAGVSYVEIEASALSGVTNMIKIYPSGRIQIN